MHFTREPIIQTVVTPKDGCKLVVRNSKGGGQEDYLVDAVEVVSFGEALFFRSLEKPKSFLVPVSDYEILELKETRMVLKNVGIEKSIKIGGGKDSSRSKDSDDSEKPTERKRERRRPRRRKSSAATASKETSETAETSETSEKPEPKKKAPKSESGKGAKDSTEKNLSETDASEEPPTADEAKVSTSFLSKLFPPPPGLIKEKFKKEREKESEAEKADDPEVVEKKKADTEKIEVPKIVEKKEPELVPQVESPKKKSSEESSDE